MHQSNKTLTAGYGILFIALMSIGFLATSCAKIAIPCKYKVGQVVELRNETLRVITAAHPSYDKNIPPTYDLRALDGDKYNYFAGKRYYFYGIFENEIKKVVE